MADDVLQPPMLTPPEPVAPVAASDALGKVPVPAGERAQLDANAAALAKELASLSPDSEAYKEKLRALEALATGEITRSANVANRMLERPTRAMAALDEGSPVAKTLLDLRGTVERLDPARQGDLFSPRKLLGVLPFGNKLRDYFRGYESSQTHLNAIIEALRRGKDELLRDNGAIEAEKATMWTLMGELEKHGYLARALGDAVEREVAQIEVSDPERAKTLREDVLFTARQKEQDIATQLAVNVQGYMALDLIKRNNAELVKGVDRATTTTVAALRTAVITAQAVANQKLVLDQITALQSTTSDLIVSTSKLLRSNATRIQEGASSATVDVEKLKEAFANVRATIDGMADYRSKALVSMERTVDALNAEVGKAKQYLATRRDLGVLESGEPQRVLTDNGGL
ncbi:MAG: toxic anion resistance protein [Candidatus Eremiobacteraeota bacterium]|nr:toxic anion resistance protein [Candidatus Eremiobacteraeota bacterium]